MPTYLVHGFRWPRELIRIHVILHHLDDAAANWLIAPQTTRVFLEDFIRSYPNPMSHLPNLRFAEQYDPSDFKTKHQPYAYVADVLHEIKLGVAVDELTNSQGFSDAQWNAVAELRDELCPGQPISWYIVVCGDEDRLAGPPPTPNRELKSLRKKAAGKHWAASDLAPASQNEERQKMPPPSRNGRDRSFSLEQRSQGGASSLGLHSNTTSLSFAGQRLDSRDGDYLEPMPGLGQHANASSPSMARRRDATLTPPVVPRVRAWSTDKRGAPPNGFKKDSRLKAAMKKIFNE